MTHLSRPRLWLAALLAALSLMVFVSLRTRHSVAQDEKGPVVITLSVTPKTLRSPGIQANSLVDVFVVRRDDDTEDVRIEKLLSNIKVDNLAYAPGAKDLDRPNGIGLQMTSELAVTLNKARESKNFELFLKLAESSAKKPSPSGEAGGVPKSAGMSKGTGAGGFGGFSPATGNDDKGSKKSQTQRKSTIVIQNEVVVLPKEVIESQQVTMSPKGNVAFGRSRNRDLLFGYSVPLRKWVKQPTDVPLSDFAPSFGESVVVVKLDDADKSEKTYFAFSGDAGRWASIKVSSDASYPTIHNNTIVVTDGETTHVFKNDTGKWSTPIASIADNVVPTEPARSPLIGTPAWRHSYQPAVLTYSDGQGVYLFDLDADGTLDVVPVDGMKSSIPDENLPDDNHSVVEAWRRLREAAGERREALAERATLQETLGPKHPAIVRLNERLAELTEEEQDWNTRLKAFAPPASFGRVTVSDWRSRLKSELQQAEQDAEQAARAGKSAKNSRDKDQAQARLREAVSKAFASRQTLQQLEAELLRERLRQVDDRLQERDRLRDRIIQRRVEELSNPNLDWEASKPMDVSKYDRPQPLTQARQSPGLVPQSDQQPPEEPISVVDHKDGSIVLKYTIYEANEAALKELGLTPKTNEEITADNKLAGTTTVTDMAKIALLPELLKREDLKLLTRGRSVNKLNAPLPLFGVSKDLLGVSTDPNHGLESLAQATVVKNGRLHLFVKMGDPRSNRPLVELDPLVKLDSVLFKTELLLNSTDPSLVGPFKIPGENNPWLVASFVAEVVLPGTPTPALQPRNAERDEPTSEDQQFDQTSLRRDAPNTKPESRVV